MLALQNSLINKKAPATINKRFQRPFIIIYFPQLLNEHYKFILLRSAYVHTRTPIIVVLSWLSIAYIATNTLRLPHSRYRLKYRPRKNGAYIAPM
jgi:hypothetical protein